MIETLAVLALLLFVGATGVLIWLAHRGRLPSRALGALAAVSFFGLLAMVLTDWPLEVLAPFWRNHAVVSSVTSTLLLVGVGFLAFEARDAQRQEALDESVTSAGLGGLVNHVLDVEVVLALIGSPDPPTDARWPDWRGPDRPLQWLRADREHLGRLTDGSPSRRDPGSALPQLIPEDERAEWRLVLVDQAVRRVIGGIRDWSAVVSRSRSGLRVLVSFGALRNDLLAIERSLISGDDQIAGHLLRVRIEARVLALALEVRSGAPVERSQVLLSLQPLETHGLGPQEEEGSLSRIMADEWTRGLSAARRRLEGGAGR